MLLFVALQLAASVPHRVSPGDSAALIAHLRDAEFRYMWDWRHEWETWKKDVAEALQNAGLYPPVPLPLPAPILAQSRTGNCPPRGALTGGRATAPTDVDAHDLRGHFLAGAPGSRLFYCPTWLSPFDLTLDVLRGDVAEDGRVLDEAAGVDAQLPPSYRDTVRAHRAPLLQQFDSAASRLPGDAWLAGQRVRLHVDQGELSQAWRAATECGASAGWCGMLRGYVQWAEHDARAAEATFDAALARMPADSACRWNDVSDLLSVSGSVAYRQLSCAAQAKINAQLWWLADPLYLVPGNDRRAEHFARRVLAVLHAGNEVDEREDVRDKYMGQAQQAMIVRYGWPSAMEWVPPAHCAPGVRGSGLQGLCYFVVPPGWSRFDTHGDYLGLTGVNEVATGPVSIRPGHPPAVTAKPGHGPVSIGVAPAGGSASAAGPGPSFPRQVGPLYWGPRYHTVPAWSAISDPLHAKAADWDLGPQRWNLGPEHLDSLIWDTSWWAPEFYDRHEGPLVDLASQVGFIRRHASAAIVAATQWAIDSTILAPPTRAAVAVITSGGATEKPHIVGVTMDGAHTRAILTPVESRPLLLGLEMVPQGDSGAAGRTRFGIAPPPPLGALGRGDLAVSDVMLVRAAPGEAPPRSIQEVLPRMYGSTTLVDPSRVALFWEVYGQNDGDTVDVSLRIVRRSGAGGLARLGAALGVGSAGEDSITVRWREPRPGDPLAFSDSGASVRPRGFALDLPGLAAGTYTLSVRVDRRQVSASSPPREFMIVRP